MSLLFKISNNKYYRTPTGGKTHYLVEIYNKEDLSLAREEQLCEDKNINGNIRKNIPENINCKICNLILKKLNSNLTDAL